jgi:sugar phosphate permease
MAILFKLLRDDAPTEVRANEIKRAEPIGLILKNPAALLLCGVFFLATAASSAVLNWCNTYAHDVLGLNLADSALVGPVMITTAGFFSVLVGGFMADKFAAKSSVGRFTVLAIGLTCAALFLLPFPLVTSVPLVGFLLFATSFGKGLFDGCIYAAMHDVMPAEARATAAGLMTMLGFFGAGITTVVLPAIAVYTGLAAGFAMMAGLYLAAVVALLVARPMIARVIAKQEGGIANA